MTARRSLLTLTSDFGEGSPYVAQLKASILTINPEAVIVDVTHAIAPQDIRGGARVVAETCPQFPAGTVHVAVVDPGVGTQRRILASRIGASTYVAPDNGLLSRLARQRKPAQTVALNRPEFWRQPVSNTFHGRDIMAPAAAHISGGAALSDLGDAAEGILELPEQEAVRIGARIHGQVVEIDSFGNLLTNISRQILAQIPAARWTIRIRGRSLQGLAATYADGQAGDLLALVGSGDWLEVAVVRGSARRVLEAAVDDPVEVLGER